MIRPGSLPVPIHTHLLQARAKQTSFMQPAPARRQRGIALVAVLWIITALTVLILSFNASVRSHLDVTTTELGLARSQAVIDGALRLAIFKLKRPASASSAAPQASTWPADGASHEVAVVGRDVRITIQDEQGFIDLNTAPAELLKGLLLRYLSDPSQAERLTANIVDWRDADDEATGIGAENPAYIAAGRSAGAGNRPFADASELRSVLGISSRDAAALLPYLTIYGGQSKINVTTAPPEVIQALPGITDGAVAGILRLRQKNDTDPNLLLESLSKWQQFLSTTSGPAYRIRIEVTDRDLVPAAIEATVLVQPTSKQAFHILEWREIPPPAR